MSGGLESCDALRDDGTGNQHWDDEMENRSDGAGVGQAEHRRSGGAAGKFMAIVAIIYVPILCGPQVPIYLRHNYYYFLGAKK